MRKTADFRGIKRGRREQITQAAFECAKDAHITFCSDATLPYGDKFADAAYEDPYSQRWDWVQSDHFSKLCRTDDEQDYFTDQLNNFMGDMYNLHMKFAIWFLDRKFLRRKDLRLMMQSLEEGHKLNKEADNAAS